MEQRERFCSKCGKDSTADRARPSNSIRRTDWDTHVQVVAWIFIVSGVFIAIPGLFMLVFPGMLMIGMVPHPFPLAGPLFSMIALIFMSVPVCLVAAGMGLLKYRDWARTLTLVLSAFMLLGFPFGTAIGVYAFWALNSAEGRNSFRARSVQAMA